MHVICIQYMHVTCIQCTSIRPPTGSRQLNTKGVRAWQNGVPCIWRRAGVWDLDASLGTPVLLKSDHFASLEGRPFGRNGVSFVDKFLVPFYKSVIAAVRIEMPGDRACFACVCGRA